MKKILSLIGLSLISVSALLAQTKVISGTVSSYIENEGPIPGVSVIVKGTTVGTVTDNNGKYVITVPFQVNTLVFSYIGMKTVEVDISGRSTIDVTLEADLLGLEEVVVTALGIKRESRALGYSVQKVGSPQIANSNNTNIINSLGGKVAGVRVTSSSGAAGASTFLEIRGSTSLTGNNQPLFVIDGLPVWTGGGDGGTGGVAYSDRAIDLNPDDIESLSILRGGAATALYGLRASNGVILISTKKGSANTKMKVDLHTSVSIEKISKTQAVQNKYAQGSSGGYVSFLEWAYEQPFNHVASPADGQPYRNVSWGARVDTCSYTTDPSWTAPDANFFEYLPMDEYLAKWDENGRIVSAADPKANGKPVRVYDPYDFFQTGTTYNNSLSVTGGNETATYFLSISNNMQSGIVPNNTFGRTTVKLSGDSKLTKKLSSSASITYMNTNGDRIQQGSNSSGVMLGLLRTPPTFNNAAGYKFPDGTQRNYRGGGGFDNPYWTVNEIMYHDDVNRIIGYLAFVYEPTAWLSFSYKLGTDMLTYGNKQYFAKNSSRFPAGFVSVFRDLEQDINSDLLMSVRKELGNSFLMTFTAGNNLYHSYANGSKGDANGIEIPGFYNLINSSSVIPYEFSYKKRTAAFFGDLGFSYKDMVYVNATGRQEWSTTLPANANSFFYPSISGSFIFTELPFLKDNPVLSFGKVRTSYAIVANDAAPYHTTTSYYQASGTDGWSRGIFFPFLEMSGFTLSHEMGNDMLRPEKMKSFEVGTDIRLFSNRISIDLSYFHNKNSDLLLSVPVTHSTGFSTRYTNAGTMETRGVEIMVNAEAVKSNMFRWDIGLTFSNPRTMVTALAPEVENIMIGGFDAARLYAVVGEPYRVLYGYKYLRDPESGKIIINDEAYLDDNNVYGPGVYGYPATDPEIGNLGTVQPDWIMGITNSFSFKGFTLSGLIDIKHGGKMFNGSNGTMVYFGTSAQTLNREVPYIHEGLLGHLNSENEIVHYAADGETELPGPGDPNTISKPDDENYCYWNGTGSMFNGPIEPFVESSEYIRLREVTLSYTFNAVKLKSVHIRSLEAYFTGRNLWLRTPFSGIDPETNLFGASNIQGYEYFNMPGTRAFTFGARIGF